MPHISSGGGSWAILVQNWRVLQTTIAQQAFPRRHHLTEKEKERAHQLLFRPEAFCLGRVSWLEKIRFGYRRFFGSL
jgi:hypothetical protein